MNKTSGWQLVITLESLKVIILSFMSLLFLGGTIYSLIKIYQVESVKYAFVPTILFGLSVFNLCAARIKFIRACYGNFPMR